MVQTFIKLNAPDSEDFKLLVIEGDICMDMVHKPHPVLVVDGKEYPVSGTVEIISQNGYSIVYYENQNTDTEEPNGPVASDPAYGPDTKVLELEDGRWIVSNGYRGTFIADKILLDDAPIVSFDRSTVHVLTALPDVKIGDSHTIGDCVDAINNFEMVNAQDLYVADFAVLEESKIGFVQLPEIGYALQGQWQHGFIEGLKVAHGYEFKETQALYIPNIYGYSYVDMTNGKDVLAVMDYNISPFERMFTLVPQNENVEEA